MADLKLSDQKLTGEYYEDYFRLLGRISNTQERVRIIIQRMERLLGEEPRKIEEVHSTKIQDRIDDLDYRLKEMDSLLNKLETK